jgi:class 3 adenylate cyclase/predicted ATPase
MDIGVWLRGLGLARYEAAFRENEIDEEVLPHLTAEDLKDLGITTIGHRRKLLAAIVALGTPATSEDVALGSTISAPPKALEISAERRPITVMFCDLVGSTEIAARLDAEDWRNLVSAYLDEASTAVTELGGHVLKKLGDGLMALFGYPQAQENDAERAVRAGLAIQRALAEINAKNRGKGAPELSARIGIESGPVVVEASGEVFGDAPNVAARVQAAAEPGAVLVTRCVQHQIAGLFVAEEKGAHSLKGVPEPVSLYRIVRASGAGRRKGARALTPFVGREEELGLLARRWDQARGGEGQLTLVVGEPGLGKSRLIEEFHSRLAETPHTWVEWSASQLLQNTPLHPIAEWGRQRFGIDTPGEQRLADLEASLKQVKLDSSEYAPLLAPLLDIPMPSGRAPNSSPEEMRRKQLAAILAWIMAGARTQPIVLAFEDLQWADPTSIDVLRALSEQGARTPILVIATTRPEFRSPWSMRSHHSVLSLAPLDHAQVGLMIAELASRHALSREMVKGVSERTAGVPLFVEEVTRLLLERGEQDGAQTIPATLQQSLAARLDRLGEAREIAQIGAVLGRGFSYGLLRNVAGALDLALCAALQRLVDADILFVEGIAPQSIYRFKHALIQDAAYDSLLKSSRQSLHASAGEILERQPESAAAQPEVIAHHFTQAGLDDRAIEWWGKAGDAALRRSAFQEATAHLGKAIEMADTAGATVTTASSQRLKLQTDYGQAVMWSKGFAAREATSALARVDDHGTQADNTDERLKVYLARFLRSFIGGELHLARQMAADFVRQAEQEHNESAYALGKRHLGMACAICGDFGEAKHELEIALSNASAEITSDEAPVYGVDTTSSAAVWLAIASWQVGQFDQARALIQQGTKRAVESGHAPTIGNARWLATILDVCRDDPSAALQAAEALADLGRQHAMAHFTSLGEIIGAWAAGRLYDPVDAASTLRTALASYAESGNRVVTPWFHGLLAEIEFAGSKAELALESINKGLEIGKATGDRFADSYLHRLRGDILLQRDAANAAPAEEAYRSAIAVAKQQGARTHELLAALALTKFYRSVARLAEAHAVLAPALEGFSPTPEMPEIAEAQALLGELLTAPDTNV